jgi:hypothetical protein
MVRESLFVALLFLTVVAGCRSAPAEPSPAPAASATEESKTLKLEGIEVEVPAPFVALEAERVKRLEESARQAEPSATYAFAALRDPAGMSAGSIYVQRSDLTRPLPAGVTNARAALLAALEETAQMLTASGATIVHRDQTERDGGMETCFEAQMGSATGKVLALTMCSLFYVAPSEKLRGLTVTCLAKPGAKLCVEAMKTRKYKPEKPLPLDAPVTPVPSPGLAGVEKTGAAGIVFGSSRASFLAACRKAGHVPDRFDWKLEPPVVRTWYQEGKIAQCSGPFSTPDWANVVQVNVIFHEDKLVTASLYVSEEQSEMENRLAVAYPERAREYGRSVHIINRDARDDALVSVSAGPSRVPRSKSVVTFLSRRGMDAPPLITGL